MKLLQECKLCNNKNVLYSVYHSAEHANFIDAKFFMAGACEGTLACSTCHLIFKQTDFEQLPSPPTDEELDMLDLAFDLHET